MALHHHRTIDRIATILEHAARHPRGTRLTEFVSALEASKSSVQTLVSGLVASGYLVEQEHKYFIGPALLVLTLMAGPTVMQGMSHEQVVALHKELGYNVLVGVRVGDTLVYVDQAGEGPIIEFLAYSHRRRPLLTTATGKVILAHLPPGELQGILGEAEQHNPKEVERFLLELPSIQRTALAYNIEATIPGLFAVATILRNRQGRLIGGVCINGDLQMEGNLEDIGARLLCAVRAWENAEVEVEVGTSIINGDMAPTLGKNRD